MGRMGGVIAAAALCIAFVAPVGANAVPAADPGTSASVLSAPVQYVEVPGARLGYRVAGSGRPLVLIPGSSNTMAEWDPRLLDSLARAHRVIVFDNRGAGTSAGDVANLTIELMADDVARLIAKVAHGRADVLGWSMGGYIAQELAIRDPQAVRRLVLASTDCGGPQTLGPTPRALRILTDPGASTSERMSILFPRNRQGAAAAWTAAVGQAYAAAGYQPGNAFTVNADVARAQNRAAGPLWLGAGDGTCSRLGRISASTLVAGGRQDVVVPIGNHKALATGIPRARSVTYPDAGHAFLFQPGLRFAATVQSFLAS